MYSTVTYVRYKRRTSPSSPNISRLRIYFWLLISRSMTSSIVCQTATSQRKHGNFMAVALMIERDFMAQDFAVSGCYHTADLRRTLFNSSKGRACRSERLRLSLSLLSVLCPSNISLLPEHLCYRAHIGKMRSSVCMMLLRLKQSHMPVSRSDYTHKRQWLWLTNIWCSWS